MDASINSSSNLNFEGKLISKTKIKFNRKKLAKVAEHYKKLSEDLPDLFINTYTVDKDCAEGILKTSQSLSFTTKNSGIDVWAMPDEFKQWFNKTSPRKIAKAFVNFTRFLEPADKTVKKSWAIDDAIAKLKRKITLYNIKVEDAKDFGTQQEVNFYTELLEVAKKKAEALGKLAERLNSYVDKYNKKVDPKRVDTIFNY